MVWKIAVLAGILSACFACRHAPEAPVQLVDPDWAVRAEYFAGTPISGPQAKEVGPFGAQDCLFVRATFVALEQMPPGLLEPLSARARLIADTRTGLSILHDRALTRHARYGRVEGPEVFLSQLSGEAAGRSEVFSTAEAALPRGATVVFRLSGQNASGRPVSRHGDFAVQVGHRTSNEGTVGDVEIALSVEAKRNPLLPFTEPDADAPATGPREGLARTRTPSTEIVVFDGFPSEPPQCHGLLLPLPAESAESRTLAVILETAPGTQDNLTDEALGNARQGLEKSLAQAAAEAEAPRVEAPLWPSLASALQSLSDARLRRMALSFLARQTGARICEDIAMVADEESLTSLASRVSDKLEAERLVGDEARAQWVLDRSALEMLHPLLADGEIQPELVSVLAGHAGELSRRPASLGDAMSSASSSRELTERFVEWNRIFLEDTSPASRVRAYDWLRSQGQAPTGYDPLASRSARRAALMKAREASGPLSPLGEQQ